MPVLGYRATPAVHRVPDCDLEAHKAKIKGRNCSPGLLQAARNPCAMSEPGSEWTPSETVALIDAYIWMWLSDRAERTFVKAYLVRSLIAGPIAGRSKQSIEYKLRNVSIRLMGFILFLSSRPKQPFVLTPSTSTCTAAFRLNLRLFEAGS